MGGRDRAGCGKKEIYEWELSDNREVSGGDYIFSFYSAPRLGGFIVGEAYAVTVCYSCKSPTF